MIANHNVNLIGSIQSIPGAESIKSNTFGTLMFLPNPNFLNFVSPFQMSLLKNYNAECMLEKERVSHFLSYPSRMTALFLFDSPTEAQVYGDQKKYEGRRELKTAHSVGDYMYSKHDMTWVDFLREEQSLDQQTINSIAKAYWTGEKTSSHTLLSCGQPWVRTPIMECLYNGRIEFDLSS